MFKRSINKLTHHTSDAETRPLTTSREPEVSPRPRPKSIIVSNLPLFNPHWSRTVKERRTSDTRVFEIESMHRLPSLTDVPLDQQPALFAQKLRHCCLIFDFNDTAEELFGKEVKQRTLRDLIDCVYSGNPEIFSHEEVYQEMFRMFSKNVFRVLSPFINPAGEAYDPDEDDPVLDPVWPHLQLVYDLLIRFLDSSEFNISLAKKYVDHNFVLELISLFNNEDPRERDLLKTVLHRIYGKFLNIRAFVRKAIANVFLEFIYETDRHNGITEFLEFLGSIINGFALPLKEEHKIFLLKVLIPLHKARSYTIFHPQLSYCVQQYVSKDPTLSNTVILGLLRIWPLKNGTKQVEFLDEIEPLIETMNSEQFGEIVSPLFHRLSQCIASPQFSVAERALHYWSNFNIVTKMVRYIPTILPIVYDVLYKHSRTHWYKSIHAMSFHALKVMMEGDPKFFRSFTQDYETEMERRRISKQQIWNQLGEIADSNANKMELVTERFEHITVGNRKHDYTHPIENQTIAIHGNLP